jgi:hypothetical protein
MLRLRKVKVTVPWDVTSQKRALFIVPAARTQLMDACWIIVKNNESQTLKFKTLKLRNALRYETILTKPGLGMYYLVRLKEETEKCMFQNSSSGRYNMNLA